MVSGWRKTFHTSNTMPQNAAPLSENKHFDYDNTNPSPKITSNFSIFSTTSSIPHSESRCKPNSPLYNNTPNHQCNITPSSPNSTLSLLKSTLRLSKSWCGICSQSVKLGQGKAIFTAECSHVFHFPCIAAHVRENRSLTCPVCNANWKQLQTEDQNQNTAHEPKTTMSFKTHHYNDDEPLMLPTSVSRFNPIPESNENEEDDDDDDDEHNDDPLRFHVSPSLKTRNIHAFFTPEAAILSSNRSSDTYVALFKVKSQPRNAAANRPPVDLVAVLDVTGSSSAEELRMLKRSMQVVISSLASADRLSVIAFSGVSKRLFPLRRMTGRGQTTARQVVDALAAVELRRDGTPARNSALKKAAKVLEDRRQKNTVAKIILLTNSHEGQRLTPTPFAVHSLRYNTHDGACEKEFETRVGNLLSVMAQDLRLEFKVSSRSAPAEIAAVYCINTSSVAALSADSAALGDINAAEERELLVEIKVPGGSAWRGSQHHLMSVRCSHRDPFTQELVNSKEREFVVPRPHTVRSSDPRIQRLRRCHVSAKAVAESRRLAARNDVSAAIQLLSSARASMSCEYSDECLRCLEAEQAELTSHNQKLRSNNNNNSLEDKGEPITPMSAWRVAEKLAKVAIMRKSMNKVSDLHGFEDARF